MTGRNPCQIYLISPPKIDLDKFYVQLSEAFSGGHIGAFQLRLKDTPDAEIIEAANVIMDLCHKNGAQFIMNDRPDLAKKVNADGVHIGSDDGDYDKARKILGTDKIIGVSCYDSSDRAIEFGEKGADYVSFGAFFPTKTKETKATPSVDILKFWSTNSVLPCVAIGGINADNCRLLADNGADFIAVISYVWDHKEGPEKAVEELNRKLA